jgi:ABC-2 type transport system ATP-binding protein
MRRRLDLAAALVANPPVLFLDEPTTGLDLPSRLALWDAIEALTMEGTTVLLTTQQLDEADHLADRIAVIDRGLLIAEGSSDELKRRVGGDRLELRLEDPTRCEAAAATLAAIADDTPFIEGGTLRVPLRARKGAIAEAVRLLDREGIGIDDIALRSPKLDDVFLMLTGHVAEEQVEDSQEEEERAA